MFISKSFSELKKSSRRDSSALPGYRLALLGDCATQHLAVALRGAAFEKGFALEVFDADYDQIQQLVIDQTSELYEAKPDAVLFFMCTEKLYEEYCSSDARSSFADTVLARIKSYHNALRAVLPSARIIQCSFAIRDDYAFGSFGSCVEASFGFQLRRLSFLLCEYAAASRVFIADLERLRVMLGDKSFRDDRLYYTAKMPLSFEALALAADSITDIVQALRGSFKKCAILDLDNTLWGGVIGDDGLEGIEIGELGTGHAFQEFQLWLRELKRRGIILAVCSKNNDEAAREPFISHPEMVLRLDDIAVFIANWNDKATNIKTIQSILNIGFDSMVFIDDNPFERELVRSMLPDVTVPELPDDPAEYLAFLRNLNLFETASYSAEDSARTGQYQAEQARVELQSSFQSLDDYLTSLQMKMRAVSFEPFSFPRISQLTQRSNQFNLRTVRYTESDIARIASDSNYITLCFSLSDRFGSHGIISVAILEKRQDSLFVDTLLMSCRVLKRTAEEYIFNSIVAAAAQNGFSRVIGQYIKTPKNSMVSQLYEKMGFSPLEGSDNCYFVNVSDYKPHACFIGDE